jgi:hypothetical protein
VSTTEKKAFTIELDAETVSFLELLGVGLDSAGAPDVVEIVLEHLAYSAADGVRRSGSWERKWVTQVFGDGFKELLEPDLQRPTRCVPRKKT